MEPAGLQVRLRRTVIAEYGSAAAADLRMGEDVLLAPAQKVEPRTVRQEPEAGLRQRLAALARQHGVEFCLERMQMQHVGGGVGDLRLAEFLCAPVGTLLLL